MFVPGSSSFSRTLVTARLGVALEEMIALDDEAAACFLPGEGGPLLVGDFALTFAGEGGAVFLLGDLTVGDVVFFAADAGAFFLTGEVGFLEGETAVLLEETARFFREVVFVGETVLAGGSLCPMPLNAWSILCFVTPSPVAVSVSA